ncbi:MAG TPA: hypothetical protein PKJ83_02325 [Cyclobacteriaceae bacterium]|nr:hypothetical protein [Cyclobacteriaceae bacterium]HPW61019.1 hypothetical protein [Cyclobacteriaceae bacterium]
MIKTMLVIFLLFPTLLLAQQSETFDIATFSPPAGWKRESADFAASYVITNNKTGGWCRVAIYKSIGSSGDPQVDFISEWNNLAAKDHEGIITPTPETSIEDGWTANSGVSKFIWQQKDAFILLNTISGYGRVLSIAVTMNSDEFMKDVEKFLNSLELKKPEGQIISNNVPTGKLKPEQSIVISGTPGNQGISTATTNFDDGWVAQPFADYVRVTKGNITVLLHYPIEITDELRNTGDVEGNLFDRLMQPRYVVSNITKYDNRGPCYFCVYFYEADVVEKSTGKKYHAGFRIFTQSGVSRCVEILSPSAQDFQREFPTQEKVEALRGYNKFAVTQADLLGTWEESGGSYVNMYSTVTGAYAGMNSASSAHKFIFKNDGTYFSNHKGAYGMVGSMTFFDQKYNGNYTLTNWDITLTKRFEGKTDVFWAEFEAVRGGRVLHLTDKTASGIKYHLVKTE